jgi:hypothetical protein
MQVIVEEDSTTHMVIMTGAILDPWNGTEYLFEKLEGWDHGKEIC